MIKALTKEQEKLIPIYLDKFLSIGRNTKPIDDNVIKESVRYLYENILQIPLPKIIIVDSPNQLRTQLWNQLWNQLENQLWDQLDNQLRNQLRNQLENQLWDQLDNQLRNQLGNQLRTQLRNQLENQLRTQLWNQLGNQLGNQLRYQLWDQFISNLEYTYYYHLSFVFNEVLESELTPKLNSFVTAISNIHLASFTNELAIISRFPTKLCLDNKGKLHHEKDKAIEYSNGFGYYADHGKLANSKVEIVLNKF